MLGETDTHGIRKRSSNSRKRKKRLSDRAGRDGDQGQTLRERKGEEKEESRVDRTRTVNRKETERERSLGRDL